MVAYPPDRNLRLTYQSGERRGSAQWGRHVALASFLGTVEIQPHRGAAPPTMSASFIDRHNQNPKPFKWTNSADQYWLR